MAYGASGQPVTPGFWATVERVTSGGGAAVSGTSCGNIAAMDELLHDEQGGVAGASGVAVGVKPGTILTVAGTGKEAPRKGVGEESEGDGNKATAARLRHPYATKWGPAGSFFFCADNRVRKVGPEGTISSVFGVGDTAMPSGVAGEAAAYFYVADSDNNQVFRIGTDGSRRRVAGNGQRRDEVHGKAQGDGGKALEAPLYGPRDIAVDQAGNMYLADGYRVRRISTDQTIDTVAGNGGYERAPDGSKATETGLPGITGIAVDWAGNLYIADNEDDRVRKVAHGIITVVAGTGKPGFAGDGGKAVDAELDDPGKLACDGAGNLYIADKENLRVRMVTPDGRISTVAGNGTRGSAGDGGPATAAQLNIISGLACDRAGNLLIADYPEHRVRLVVRTTAPPPKSRPVKAISGFSHLNNQHARPGEPFGQPLQVEARDTNGKMVPAARIRFEVDAATGSTFKVNPKPDRAAEVFTSDKGLATAPELVAGPTPGKAIITVTAPDSKGHAPAHYTAHVDRAT